MKVGVIQLNTKWDKKENLDTIKKYVEEAAAEKAGACFFTGVL